MKDLKVIFYAGQNDPHSGILPRSAPSSHIHSPHFASTLEALEYLATLANHNGWHILFKPHPLIGSKVNISRLRALEHITMIPDANIFSCMARSNLTVTILSQVSYMALIHQAPCILLGRNQLSGKGCLYEIQYKYSCESVIREAIRERLTKEQKNNFRIHCAQLIRYYLFSFDSDRFALGRSLREAATYLRDNMLRSQTVGFQTNYELISSNYIGFKNILSKTYSFLRFAEKLMHL